MFRWGIHVNLAFNSKFLLMFRLQGNLLLLLGESRSLIVIALELLLFGKKI